MQVIYYYNMEILCICVSTPVSQTGLADNKWATGQLDTGWLDVKAVWVAGLFSSMDTASST